MKRTTRLEHLVIRNLDVPRKVARRWLVSGAITAADGSSFSDPRKMVGEDELPLQVHKDGQALTLHHDFSLMLNKPTGCVTALRDDTHDTANALLAGAPLFAELRPIGRLDKDTSGLLLFTTDGQWLHRMIHPKHQAARTYHAALARNFSTPPNDFTLEDGHKPQILDLSALKQDQAHPALQTNDETTCHARITIIGGAYHEVRRIFAALGSHVLELCRVQYADHSLPTDLSPGQWRPL